MNSSFRIKRKLSVLARRYQTALRRYLAQGPDANLELAVRLGRQAVTLELETLDLALVHEQALLSRLLPNQSAADRHLLIKRAGAFFAAAILPMEETHRTAMEANAHLIRLNQTLSRRTLDLATSNRQLKKEISQRRVVEETLRQSEQHSIRLLDQSRRMQEQMRLLSQGILSAQEDERKRISRELHDVIGQVLTSINIRLAVLKTESAVNTKDIGESIAHTQRLVEKSVNTVRQFAYDLRPSLLDDLGLIAALHAFMKTFMKETGIRVHLTAFAGVEKLDSARRTVLYRVAQEALTNVARHAQASRVDVSIQISGNDIRLQIKDNGRSFDVNRAVPSRKRRRLGLLGMRERVEMVGGKFSIESSPGQGTTIHAQVPFLTGVKKERAHS